MDSLERLHVGSGVWFCRAPSEGQGRGLRSCHVLKAQGTLVRD